MNDNEEKSLEVYTRKFDYNPEQFTDFQALDYVKLLKNSGDVDEAIEVGKTFLSLCPNLHAYKNQYGYALFNKYINIEESKIKENEGLFYSIIDDILIDCKQERYSPVEATIYKAIKYILHTSPVDYEKLLEMLNTLDVTLLLEQVFTNAKGKEYESKKERYYRLRVRALFETKRYKECVQCANDALSLSLKWHYNALQWITYYRASCLVELGQYEEAERQFLSLHNRIRGVNIYEVLCRTYSNLDNDKQANAYLLYEFFQNGYSFEQMSMFKRLLESTIKTGMDELIEVVDAFIYKLSKEKHARYNSREDYDTKEEYKDISSSDLYDKMYDLIMKNVSAFVERKEGTIVFYNLERGFGTISVYDQDGVFFRQEDYIYDEEVQRRDKVEYTSLYTYDTKKDRITTKAILISTLNEYTNYGY